VLIEILSKRKVNPVFMSVMKIRKDNRYNEISDVNARIVNGLRSMKDEE